MPSSLDTWACGRPQAPAAVVLSWSCNLTVAIHCKLQQLAPIEFFPHDPSGCCCASPRIYLLSICLHGHSRPESCFTMPMQRCAYAPYAATCMWLRRYSQCHRGALSITLMQLAHAQIHVCAGVGSGTVQKWHAQDGCSLCPVPSMQDLLRSRSTGGAPAGSRPHALHCSVQLPMSDSRRLPAFGTTS